MLVRVPQPAAPAVKKPLTPASLLDDVRAGLRYAWQWSGMFKLLIMAALLNMVMAPPGSLLPLLISKVYGRGAADLAVVESAFGIGVVVGGVLLGVWGGFKRRVYTVMMGITGMGLGVMMIALAGREQFNLVVLGMGLMGLLNAFANGPLGAIVQTKVAPEMQGRVFTVMSSLAGMAAPIGMLFAGPLADRIGIQPMYLIGALACTGIGVAGFLLPDVRTLDSQEPGGPDGDLAAQTGSGFSSFSRIGLTEGRRPIRLNWPRTPNNEILPILRLGKRRAKEGCQFRSAGEHGLGASTLELDLAAKAAKYGKRLCPRGFRGAYVHYRIAYHQAMLDAHAHHSGGMVQRLWKGFGTRDRL